MAGAEDEVTRTSTVVINDEEQYSIRFADRELPNGWRAVGKTGPKADPRVLPLLRLRAGEREGAHVRRLDRHPATVDGDGLELDAELREARTRSALGPRYARSPLDTAA